MSEANRKYAGLDGVPYRGSGKSDAGWSSSESHIQVRNQSFLYDNLDPAKSARKSRTAATKLMAEKAAKRKVEKRQEEKKVAVKKEKTRREELIREKRLGNKEQLEKKLSKTADIDVDFFNSDEAHRIISGARINLIV